MLIFTLCALLAFGLPKTALAAGSLEREANEAFSKADYGSVLKLWHSLPPDATPSKPLLRLAFQSALKLARPEEGLEVYERMVKSGQPDDLASLRSLAISFLSAYVRESKEYIRVAAYTALAATRIYSLDSRT